MSEGLDSALPAVAGTEPAVRRRSWPLGVAPPLTWMAVVGSAADLVINRVVLRSSGETLSQEAFLALDRAGAFSRNLAAVSALVAVAICLAAFGSRKSGLPLSARIGILGFGWALIPIVTLMTFLPLAWTRVELVLIVAGLAHALILLVILAGIHWRSTKPVSVALGLLMVAYVSGIASLIVSLAGGRVMWEHTERLAFAFRWSGELAYLAAAFALVPSLEIRWRDARGKWRGLAAVAGFLAVCAAIFMWRRAAGNELPDLFYGALRLDLFAEYGNVVWYAITLGVLGGVGVAATLSRDPTQRQLGAALLLLLFTGYAPRTPLALLTSVLAVALIARVALSLAHRRANGSTS